VLWGEWLDPDLWGYLGTKREEPNPIVLKTVEEVGRPPIIKVADVQARITGKCPSSRVHIIWGKWGETDTIRKETLYSYVDAVVIIKGKEATVDGRKLYVSLEAYGGQTVFTEFLVGNELQRGDIEIPD